MATMIFLFLCVIGSSISVYADELRGHVTSASCPVPGLIVEITPRLGSSEPKVVTNTLSDGRFVANVQSGDHLVEVRQGSVKVFQRVVSVNGFSFIDAKLQALGNTAVSCSVVANYAYTPNNVSPASWRPVDIAQDPAGRLLVLDSSGRVLRLSRVQSSFSAETILTVSENRRFVAVAANSKFVYAVAQSPQGQGCIVYYTDAPGHPLHNWTSVTPCGGIAADEQYVYLAHPGVGSIRILRADDLSPVRSLALPSSDSRDTTPMHIDSAGKKLFIGNDSGTLLILDPANKGKNSVSIGNDAIHSLAVTSTHVVAAIGNTIRCVSLANYLTSNPPCFGGGKIDGQISGAVVDGSNTLWILNMQKGTLSAYGTME